VDINVETVKAATLRSFNFVREAFEEILVGLPSEAAKKDVGL